MQDHELKNLLEETCPVRPGQEERAWNALKERMAARTGPAWLPFPASRGALVGLTSLGTLVCTVLLVGIFIAMQPAAPSYLSADSQAPGIYATAFYSKSAKAQVVWLNGLAPASDHPTYLDPSTGFHTTHDVKNHQPAGDPNSL